MSNQISKSESQLHNTPAQLMMLLKLHHQSTAGPKSIQGKPKY